MVHLDAFSWVLVVDFWIFEGLEVVFFVYHAMECHGTLHFGSHTIGDEAIAKSSQTRAVNLCFLKQGMEAK